jgi:hypothetical protein
MIKKCNDPNFSYLIGALADGSLYHNPKEYIYRIIKEILDENFHCSEVLGPYKSKETAKPYYELHIHGIKQLIKFREMIKPCHPDKQLQDIN